MPQEIITVRPTSQAHDAEVPVARTVSETEKKQTNNPSSSDTFTSSGNDQIDLAHDGKFSFTEALKNFGKGIISPITSMFSSVTNFLISVGMMFATIGLGFLVGATIMQGIGVGFFIFGGAYAAYELGKGVYKFIDSAIKGDKDGMENSFKDFGAGVGGVAMTLLGARGTAQFMKGLRTKSSKVNQLSVEQSLNQRSVGSIKEVNLKEILKDRLTQDKPVKVPSAVRKEANELYLEEIKDMAASLGIPEKENALRETLPKIEFREMKDYMGLVAFPLFYKIRIKLDPFWNFCFLKTIPHEVGHLEQGVFQLIHLSRREFVESYAEAFLAKVLSKSEATPSKFSIYITRLLLRIAATMGWDRNIKYVQTLKTVTTQADKQRAIRLIRARANYSDFKGSGYTAYSNDLLEIDADMRAILSNLKRLSKRISAEKIPHNINELRGTLKSLGQKFKRESKKPIDPAWDEISLKIKQIKDLLGSNARSLQHLAST